MSDKIEVNTGIDFCGLLGVVFIVLKLCKVIAWSWWWVLLPLYGGLGLLIVGALVIFIIYLFKGE